MKWLKFHSIKRKNVLVEKNLLHRQNKCHNSCWEWILMPCTAIHNSVLRGHEKSASCLHLCRQRFCNKKCNLPHARKCVHHGVFWYPDSWYPGLGKFLGGLASTTPTTTAVDADDAIKSFVLAINSGTHTEKNINGKWPLMSYFQANWSIITWTFPYLVVKRAGAPMLSTGELVEEAGENGSWLILLLSHWEVVEVDWMG